YSCVEYLIDISLSLNTSDYHYEEIEIENIQSQALLALLGVNMQFPSGSDMVMNRVLNKLIFYDGAKNLGQKFIIIVNRINEYPDHVIPIMKLLTDIFSNPVSAKQYFFIND